MALPKTPGFIFAIESVHFLLGLIGCLFFPATVIGTYTSHPKVQPSPQAFEMVEVLVSFYLVMFLVSVKACFFQPIWKFVLTVYFVFYSSLFVRDVYVYSYNHFEQNTMNKYIDSSIHLVGSVISLIYILSYKFYYNEFVYPYM